MKGSKAGVWAYRGVDIYPADRNGSGMRYWALTAKGRLMADTMDGMRRLIREALAKQDPFAGERFRLVNRESGARDQTPRYIEAKRRLEELRIELRAERISYGELHELQCLAEFIDKDDVELLEAAGVPESESV